MAFALKSTLIGTAHIRRDQLKWRRPLLSAVVTAILTAICIAGGEPKLAFPLAVGAWFAGVADTGEAIGDHWRSMLWTTVWISMGALLGGLTSEIGYVELLTVAAIAFACGFAGAIGPRGALNGLLMLVVYAVFAGAPTSDRGAVQTALVVVLGGVIQVIIAILPTVLRHPRALRSTRAPADGLLTRLRSHTSTDDMFLRHAARLAIAMVAATAVSNATNWPHEYWIPMTVAWMTRPDKDGTSTRVVERILGTLAGILAAAILIDGLDKGPYVLAVIIGCGVFVSLVFLQANYALAVVGLTTTVIALFTLLGEPVSGTAPYRIAATLAAGVITVLASFLWPLRKADAA